MEFVHVAILPYWNFYLQILAIHTVSSRFPSLIWLAVSYYLSSKHTGRHTTRLWSQSVAAVRINFIFLSNECAPKDQWQGMAASSRLAAWPVETATGHTDRLMIHLNSWEFSVHVFAKGYVAWYVVGRVDRLAGFPITLPGGNVLGTEREIIKDILPGTLNVREMGIQSSAFVCSLIFVSARDADGPG